MSTLFELISRAPGNRTAVIVPETGAKITYDSLRNQVEDAAAVLVANGIGQGNRVAIALPNGLPGIVCFLAAAAAGTAAPLNAAYREEEFEFFMEDTKARALIVPPDGGKEARQAAAARKIPVLEVSADAQGVVRLAGGSSAKHSPMPDSDGTALILHTSGSTGRPKRVPLRHRNLATSAGNIAKTYALTPDDVAVCVMPLFHVHGLIASTLATLASGGTVVVPGKFNPLSFWRMLRECRATWYSAVPTIHQLLLARVHGTERPQGAKLLRFIRSGSAPLAPETMKRLEEAFGAPVLEAYGMTEASHQIASNPLPPGARKAGSVGIATGVQIDIMDSSGKHLGAGESGEVVLKGPTVIAGYENNPKANTSSFVNGWFRTGDYGQIDSEGYLKLIARIKELINRGGEKVSPVAIDHVLQKHPAVAKAVTFGVPHPVWGEEVEAAVTLSEQVSEAELIAYCREHLAEFERPKNVHIVETIPKTATGKIQRGALALQFSGKKS